MSDTIEKYEDLGDEFLNDGKFIEADDMYTKAIELMDEKNSKYTSLLSKSSNCKIKLGKKQESKILDEKILKIDPYHKKSLERTLQYYVDQVDIESHHKALIIIDTLKEKYIDDYSLGKYNDFIQKAENFKDLSNKIIEEKDKEKQDDKVNKLSKKRKIYYFILFSTISSLCVCLLWKYLYFVIIFKSVKKYFIRN